MLIAMPMLKKFHYFYAPRGLLIDYRDKELLQTFTNDLKKYAKKKKAVYVIIDPYVLYKERDMYGHLVEGGFDNQYVVDNLIQCGYKHKGFSLGYGKNMQYIRWMYSMSLEGTDVNTLWKNLHHQAKRSISRTEKYHIQVRELSIDEMDVFEDIMKKTGERRQFHTRNVSFYQNQCRAYGENLKVLLAYLDVSLYRKSLNEELIQENEKLIKAKQEYGKNPIKKYENRLRVALEAIENIEKKREEANQLEKEHGQIIPLAACMFMLCGEEVTYLIGGAYGEFRNFYASYAVQWEMIKEAISLGYKKYNFYGISGVFDENDENYGVYKFKRSFPGQVEELVGDFVLPTRKFIYAVYKALRER